MTAEIAARRWASSGLLLAGDPPASASAQREEVLNVDGVELCRQDKQSAAAECAPF
jgi:hypothetical protein